MTLRRSLRALGLAAAVALPAAAQAQLNAGADFSIASNPNGAWSYGSRSLADLLNTGTFAAYGFSGSSGSINYWAVTPGFSVPSVFKNASASPTAFATVLMQAQQLALHPGAAAEYSIVRFTAPSAGTYNVSTLFTGIDIVGSSTDVHVLVDGVSYFSGFVMGYADSVTFINPALQLGAGSVLEFVVGAGPQGNYNYDSTSLDVAVDAVPVNPVPEPASLVLMVTGMIGVVASARHARRRGGKATARA